MKLVPGTKSRYIKVSTKGRITIPSDMRKVMGIKKGDKIIFIRKGKKVILVKPERIAKSIKGELEIFNPCLNDHYANCGQTKVMKSGTNM